MYRLATIAKELSDNLARASAEKQRQIVIQSCEYALCKTEADNRLYDIWVEKLKETGSSIFMKQGHDSLKSGG